MFQAPEFPTHQLNSPLRPDHTEAQAVQAAACLELRKCLANADYMAARGYPVPAATLPDRDLAVAGNVIAKLCAGWNAVALRTKGVATIIVIGKSS